MLRWFICFRGFLWGVWCTRGILPSSTASIQWSRLSYALCQRSLQWKCTCSQEDHLLCWKVLAHRRITHGCHRRYSQVHSLAGRCFLLRATPWLSHKSCGGHALGGSICLYVSSPSSLRCLMLPLQCCLFSEYFSLFFLYFNFFRFIFLLSFQLASKLLFISKTQNQSRAESQFTIYLNYSIIKFYDNNNEFLLFLNFFSLAQ